jgi:signal peptidase
MLSTFHRLMKWGSYAVTIFLVGVVVFAAADYATGTTPFYTVTDSPSSMSPTLNYAGVAVILKVPYSSLEPGDIIAFHDPRGNPGIIVHRVVSVVECESNGLTTPSTCLVTKGDNNVTNSDTDPWNVTQSDYIGKVVMIIPYLGYISPALWGFTGPSALLPVSVIMLAAALDIILDRRRKSKNDEGGNARP